VACQPPVPFLQATSGKDGECKSETSRIVQPFRGHSRATPLVFFSLSDILRTISSPEPQEIPLEVLIDGTAARIATSSLESHFVKAALVEVLAAESLSAARSSCTQ